MKHSEGFLRLVNDAKSRIRECSVQDVRRDQESGADFVLVDVREDREWNAAHAARAIHLGKGIIERDIEAAIPDHDRKIVLYCGGGYRSASRPTRYSRWATPTFARWPAAGAPGTNRDAGRADRAGRRGARRRGARGPSTSGAHAGSAGRHQFPQGLRADRLTRHQGVTAKRPASSARTFSISGSSARARAASSGSTGPAAARLALTTQANGSMPARRKSCCS